MSKVCAACFSDLDIRAWVRKNGGNRGCDFCGGFDSPTVSLGALCSHIEACLTKFWGFAVEQLPYDGAEGGYQGRTWQTVEVLFDNEGLLLPRDNGSLETEMLYRLTDQLWCDWDWLSLDRDVALKTSWELFCENIKYSRRYFFHALGGSQDDRDAYSAEAVLKEIAHLSEQLGLIRTIAKDTILWRARTNVLPHVRMFSKDFGPPPKELSLQSNRLNSPGIPMLYLASSAATAKKETRAESVRVGQWKVAAPLTILDLRVLPKIPGTFSECDRESILGWRFLHHFAQAITQPVDRNDRAQIDYLPSQVVSEYLRDHVFEAGKIDGIAYDSTLTSRGWNLALFVNVDELSSLKFIKSKSL